MAQIDQQYSSASSGQYAQSLLRNAVDSVYYYLVLGRLVCVDKLSANKIGRDKNKRNDNYNHIHMLQVEIRLIHISILTQRTNFFGTCPPSVSDFGTKCPKIYQGSS